MPSPKTFIRQHYPKDKVWQLLDTTASKRGFRNNYVWYNGLQENGIEIISPTKGRCIQKSTKDWKMILKFNKIVALNLVGIQGGNANLIIYNPPTTLTDSVDKFRILNLSFMLDNNEKQTGTFLVNAPLPGSKKDLIVSCRFPAGLKGEHEISIFFNDDLLAGYKLKLK